MSIFFKPAVVLMGRLKYTKKLILLGAITTIIIFALTFQLVTQSLAILSFSRQELLGIQYANPLLQVMEELQNYRRLEYALTVDPTLTSSLAIAKKNVDSAIYNVLQNQAANRLNLANELNSVKNDWEFIKNQSTANITNTNRLIHTVMNLIVSACDNSNLTLDPDIDTYYLMDTYCTKMPNFIEESAVIRDIGAHVLAVKQISNDAREQLVINKTLMGQFNILQIKSNIDKAINATE